MTRILLVNPPIYDFSAYDFWMKPFGLLEIGGKLRHRADLALFDTLDRHSPVEPGPSGDPWGRGKFPSQIVPTPEVLPRVNRHYRRYGLQQSHFQEFLGQSGRWDFVLIQTGMTYWYLGVKEIVQLFRQMSPSTKIILGGVYATLCPDHARSLGADLVIVGSDLEPLWQYLGLEPEPGQPPFWEGYSDSTVGVLKLSDGCPFRCTYCSVPQIYPPFRARPLPQSIRATRFLLELGVENVTFYDDALLFKPRHVLIPYLLEILENDWSLNFHTPNALNARFLSPEIAHLMVEAGFKHFFLGFESKAAQWQKETGGKVYAQELEQAVRNLLGAGADPNLMTCYLMVGHPAGNLQELEDSIRFAHELGLRVMLSEFSPIPGTPDGEQCRGIVDLNEPLFHNKLVYTLAAIGQERLQALKSLCTELNRSLRLREPASNLRG